MSCDVTTFGELVIDLVPLPTPAGLAYLAKAGGAPANVAAGVARLGPRAAMISKIGTEVFGKAALAALQATGVETASIIRSPEHNTAIAVVSETASGEADFSFYRENCADSNLSRSEVSAELIASSKVFHVGTLPLATRASAAAQRHALSIAKANGIRVSADPNFRAAFWRDSERMRSAGLEVIGAANIVKVSAAELRTLTGHRDLAEGARALWHPELIMLAVTKGSAGADIFTRDEAVSVPGFTVSVVDTVGCGDAFTASLLVGLLDASFEVGSVETLREIAVRCCASGAIIATRSGALENMPTTDEITHFLSGPAKVTGVA
jgi:fructokinase